MDVCRDCYGHGKVHFSGEIVTCMVCQGDGEVISSVEE